MGFWRVHAVRPVFAVNPTKNGDILRWSPDDSSMNIYLSPRRLRVVEFLVTAFLIFAHTSPGANVTWTNAGTGNWFDGANWSTGTPPSSVTADVGIINNGGTAVINPADNVTTGSITLGFSLATDIGNLMMTGGSLTTTNTDIRIGGNALTTAGNGRFDQSGGTVTMNAGNLNIGIGSAGAVGTYNLSGGSMMLASANIMAIGNRGTGTVNQTGGTLYVRGSPANAATSLIQLGRNAAGGPGTGTFTLSGGTAVSGLFQFGNAVGLATSTNTFNLQGTGTLLTGTISIINIAATNNFNFVGGSLTATTVAIPLTNNGGTFRPQTLNFTGNGDVNNVVSNLVGTTTFSGASSYVQTSLGNLAIDIAGTGLNDFIDIGVGAPVGTASVAGTISINLLNGFNPSLGATFDILAADSVVNTASVIGLTSDGNGFSSSIATGGDGRQVLRLIVVPEPSTLIFLVMIVGALGGIKRPRSETGVPVQSRGCE